MYLNRVVLLLFFMLSAFLSSAKNWKAEDIPISDNSKSFVINPDNILSKSTVDNLNAVLKKVNNETLIYVNFIAVKSIKESKDNYYPHHLFLLWKNKHVNIKHNKIIFLFVQNKKSLFIENDLALNAVISNNIYKEIHKKSIEPYFAKKDYQTGIRNGVKEVANTLIKAPIIPFYYTENTTNRQSKNIENNQNNSQKSSTTSVQNTPQTDQKIVDNNPVGAKKRSIFLTIYGILVIVFSSQFLYNLALAFKEYDPYKKYIRIRYFYKNRYVYTFLTPVPFFFFTILMNRLFDVWKNAPRISPITNLPMRKLDENKEYLHLSMGQIAEQELNTQDFDVWVSDVPNDVLVLSYVGSSTKVHYTCIKCKHKTLISKGNVVAYGPAKLNGRLWQCRNCGHEEVVTKGFTPTIPKE